MKILLCAVAICVSLVHGQVDNPLAQFQCTRQDYTERYPAGSIKMHLRVDQNIADQLYIYAQGEDGKDVSTCHFEGAGTTADPWDLEVVVPLELNPDVYLGDYCGVKVETQTDNSGTDPEIDFYYVWVIRLRRNPKFLSASDYLYEIKCDMKNAPNTYQYTWPVSVSDIEEIELQQHVCVPSLRVIRDGSIVYALTLGDMIWIEAYAVCIDGSTLTPTGMFYTELDVSNSPTFDDDSRVNIIDASGCPNQETDVFQAQSCKGSFLSNDGSGFLSEVFYECGPIETFSFASDPQLILYFRARVDWCFDGNNDVCFLGACGRVPKSRKKRAAGSKAIHAREEDMSVMIEPFKGAYGDFGSAKKPTCVESNVFIVVFAVMCVLLLAVSAAGVYLVLKLNKRSRKEIERITNMQMGKVNPAF